MINSCSSGGFLFFLIFIIIVISIIIFIITAITLTWEFNSNTFCDVGSITFIHLNLFCLFIIITYIEIIIVVSIANITVCIIKTISIIIVIIIVLSISCIRLLKINYWLLDGFIKFTKYNTIILQFNIEFLLDLEGVTSLSTLIFSRFSETSVYSKKSGFSVNFLYFLLNLLGLLTLFIN